ncbi:MAG: 2-oxo acid dehydrogenase subunit E2 [Candidatus Marinimicrobia bacterium]|nr:2-oxo acid dehydrogenase subunit E2 [Candidatus Neomarinimicrobiota bacterium]
MNKMKDLNTPWRLSTLAMYKAPVDGRTYGTYEIDITEALEYIQKQKKEDKHITLTEMFAAAVGRALKYDVPDLNCYVRRGKFVARPDEMVFVSVFMEGTKEVDGFLIHHAGDKTVTEISEEMSKKVKHVRSQGGDQATSNKNLLAKFPWPFRNWLFRIIQWFTRDMGIPLKFLKVDPNSFGSAIISNIGTHGLQFGFAALFPASNIPMVITLGKIEDKAVVRNGEIVIRKILPVAGTFDHRIVDGSQGGRLASAVAKYLLDPTGLDRK